MIAARAVSRCVVAAVAVVAASACGLNDGGLFDPPAEQKQEATLRCNLGPPLPDCIDASSPASLPAWERFRMSQAALDCIAALDCEALVASNDGSELDAVNECLQLDGVSSNAGVIRDAFCISDCRDAVNVAVCDEGEDLVASLDAGQACRRACPEESQ